MSQKCWHLCLDIYNLPCENPSTPLMIQLPVKDGKFIFGEVINMHLITQPYTAGCQRRQAEKDRLPVVAVKLERVIERHSCCKSRYVTD